MKQDFRKEVRDSVQAFVTSLDGIKQNLTNEVRDSAQVLVISLDEVKQLTERLDDTNFDNPTPP